MTYTLADEIELDLAWVYRVGLDNFGEDQAGKYLNEIYKVFDLLSDNPQMGVNFKIGDKDLQRHTHKSHVIIFQSNDNDVKILRMFYGKSEYLSQL